MESSDANKSTHAPANLKLAQHHYVARLQELKQLIVTEETKFKRIVIEIDEIRAGRWDAKKDELKAANADSASVESFVSTEETNSQEKRLAMAEEEEEEEQSEAASFGEQRSAGESSIVDHSLPGIEDSDRTVQDGFDPTSSSQLTDIPQELEETDAESNNEEGFNRNSITPRGGSRLRSPTEEEQSTSVAQSPEQADTNDKGTMTRSGKRPAEEELVDKPDKKRLKEEAETPEIESQGSSGRRRRTVTANDSVQTPPAPNKRFQTMITMLYQQISQHRNGNIFHNPIKNSDAPDYHDLIKRPMDLKTIKARIKDGVITNSPEFLRDIYLMFANAIMYNRPGSDVYLMTQEMMAESEDYIKEFKQTEGLIRRT